MSRTMITKMLRNYIKENNLQNPENRREILPDEKLYVIFGDDSRGVNLNLFNMQKYINHHFIKKVVPTAV